MIKVLYFLIGILIFVEFFSVGVYFAARKCGEKKPEYCFIPFMAFAYLRRMTGVFTILTIKVNKYAVMMIELCVLALLAFLYACWGDDNLPQISAESLWQIMILIMAIVAFIIWVSLLSASRKLYRRFYVKNEGLFVALSMLVVTIPVLYVIISVKRAPRSLADLY